MQSLALSHRGIKMNYKNKIPLFTIVVLSFIVPSAFADIVVDNFSDGAAMVTDGGNCSFDDAVGATVLGGTRGIFACIDSVTGSVTSETDTGNQQFIFTINNAVGSSGLNYDNGGLLLGGADITEGGVNNALRLDFIKADDNRKGTVVATDMNNIVGTFEFDILQDANPFSETIAFAAINDLPSMDIPDFANLQSINIFFEKNPAESGDKEMILGQITALSIPGLDTDNDGTPDNEDGCPLDPNKTAPGNNGCGVPDNGGMPPSGTVGGKMIPIDSTMVLLAGTQMTAAWMIPVIVAGIGFAIVIARKF